MSTVAFPTLDDFAGFSTPMSDDLIVLARSPAAAEAVARFVRGAGIRAIDPDVREVEDLTGLRRQLRQAVPGAVFIDMDASGSGMAVALATRVLRSCGPVQIGELTLPAPSTHSSAAATYLVILRDGGRHSSLSPAA